MARDAISMANISYYWTSEGLHLFRSLGQSDSQPVQMEAVCARVGVYVNLKIISIIIELRYLLPDDIAKGEHV